MCTEVKWREEEIRLLVYFSYIHSQSTYTVYLEYHSVSPLVRMLGPPTPSPLSHCAPSRNQRAGGPTRLRVKGGGGPNLDDWRKSLVVCLNSIDSLYNTVSYANTHAIVNGVGKLCFK